MAAAEGAGSGFVSSPIAKRVYDLGLDECFAWYSQEQLAGFTKATVATWRVPLEACGLGASLLTCGSRRCGSLRVEAADNGLLAPELANSITCVKGVASKDVHLRNWLTAKQAQALLNAPGSTTIKGLRDRAILAVLLGCGLRRSEVAALTYKDVQQPDGRWCIVDRSTAGVAQCRCRRARTRQRVTRPVSPHVGEIARAGWWSRLDTCHDYFFSVSQQDIDRLKASIGEQTNPLHYRQPVADAILIVRRIAQEAIIVAQ